MRSGVAPGGAAWDVLPNCRMVSIDFWSVTTLKQAMASGGAESWLTSCFT